MFTKGDLYMREILLKPTLNKFLDFSSFAEEFILDENDLVLTNEPIYQFFMEPLQLPCRFVFQERYGAGEPSEEMITDLFADIDQDSYSRVIAVGGGAIMDIGKLLAIRRTGSVHAIFFKEAPVERAKKLVAVPTTCGTGSEVTNISVAIVRGQAGETTKLGLVSDLLIPDDVCLIPDMLRTLPYRPFFSSVIDALVHAVESYLSPSRATMTSELFGVKAIEMILEGLRRVSENGSEARLEYLDEFLTASCYAGIAFLQAGCASVHALSFPLGGTYHVPHGESNYLLFGKVLEKYDQIDPDGKLAELKQLIGRVLDCPSEDALEEMAVLEDKILPLEPLHKYGFRPEDIEIFADSVLENQQRLVVNSYVPLTRELIVEIYTELL
ncbi:MAG: 4-hydroxybutyrate dehydrogenase [Clostridiaceae bacterium]|jgi:4-hydroxybutyrate dehydrogenase|nr:4-hydroxybutyrate dehydrogenase [Clostridiaceae bacterium]